MSPQLKTALFIAPIFMFFLAGYFFGENTQQVRHPVKLDPPQTQSVTTDNIETDQPVKKGLTHKPSVQKIKPASQKQITYRDLVLSGGQQFFDQVFKKEFWKDLNQNQLQEMMSAYELLDHLPEPLKKPGKRGIKGKITTTKIGFLTALDQFYLNQNLNQSHRQLMVSFHKKALAVEKHIFVKRQVLSNLRKIITFKDEQERDTFLASLDKRAFHLSDLSVEEIISRTLSEARLEK